MAEGDPEDPPRAPGGLRHAGRCAGGPGADPCFASEFLNKLILRIPSHGPTGHAGRLDCLLARITDHFAAVVHRFAEDEQIPAIRQTRCWPVRSAVGFADGTLPLRVSVRCHPSGPLGRLICVICAKRPVRHDLWGNLCPM
jgi:hypothetical protein